MRNAIRTRPVILVALLTITGGVLLVVAGLVALSFDRLRKTSYGGLQSLPLADGTVLVLEQATFAPPHRFQFFADQSLAEWVLGRHTPIGGSTAHPPAGTELVVWLSRRDPRTGGHLDLDWWSHCTILDESGREFHNLQGLGTIRCGGEVDPHHPQPARIAGHVALPCVRHGQASFLFRVYDQHQERVAQFEVPFPAFVPKPHWQPDALPAVREVGNVAVTLSEFQMEFVGFPGEVGTEVPIRAWPVLEIRQDGDGRFDPKRFSLTVSDVLGNAVGPIELHSDDPGQQPPDDWGRLNVYESAWQLCVGLRAAPDTKFLPNEQSTFENLCLPEPGLVVPINQVRAVNGVYVELVSAAGVGQTWQSIEPLSSKTIDIDPQGQFRGATYLIEQEWRNSRPWQRVSASCPSIAVRTDSIPAGKELVARAVDNEGRRIDVKQARIGGVGFLLLDTAGRSGPISLTIAIHEPPHVDFYIAPPERARRDRSAAQ